MQLCKNVRKWFAHFGHEAFFILLDDGIPFRPVSILTFVAFTDMVIRISEGCAPNEQVETDMLTSHAKKQKSVQIVIDKPDLQSCLSR